MAQLSWLQRSRQLRLVVKRAVATLQTGSFRSIFKGSGLAFEEVRPYQPGDEVRSIDWNVTARMGQPYVKRYVEERELRILFVLDVSGSLRTGSALALKHDVAAELMALLSLAGLRYGDSMGLVLFSKQIEGYTPARRGLRHALKLVYQALYRDPAQQGTDIGQALKFTSRMAKRRSVIVILSDFLDQGYASWLHRLAARHDVYALHLQDPLDNAVPSVGLVHLVDSESGQTVLLDSRRTSLQENTLPSCPGVNWIRIHTSGSHAKELLQALAQLRRRWQSR
jgi:uncharacterized protein (DUF58 family)